MKTATRVNPALRQADQAFLAKGMASREQARNTDEYVSSDEVLDGLKQKLATAKKTNNAIKNNHLIPILHITQGILCYYTSGYSF